VSSVLYVHGLESGPRGRKSRFLESAGFTVVSELMPCGRAQIARDPVVIIVVVGAIAFLITSTVLSGLIGFVATLGIGSVIAPFASAALMRRVMNRSVAVQLRCLATHRIDAVVGSSFGGAVALELLRSGAWKGPTVLLCPAHELVAERSHEPVPAPLATLPTVLAAGVVVVHGRRDETVPLANSEALVAGSRAQLLMVDDEHRLSTTATPEHLAKWIALAQAGGSSAVPVPAQ
jgi:hypothetical protein